MSATLRGQWGYPTIAVGVLWDMEGQDSERSCSAQFARFFGGLPGDQQVHIVHILHIIIFTSYYGIV